MTNLPPIIKVSTITTKYIYHFADIHIKPNSRHAEYTEIFNQVIQNISADSVLGDRLAIFAGDITDHKEKLNSAQIICLQNFFVKLSKLCPILVIIGNHDFIEGSDNDNLTPILFGLPNLTYARDSGLYIYGQVGFCVNSLYDNKFYSAEECDKVNDQLHTLIAIYHGMVGISFGGQTTTRSKQKEDFNNFDLVLLGDIHKRSYLNSEKTIG